MREKHKKMANFDRFFLFFEAKIGIFVIVGLKHIFGEFEYFAGISLSLSVKLSPCLIFF